MPFVLSEVGSELARIVSIWLKAFGEKFMYKFSSLFETVYAFVYFHVNLSIAVCQVMEVVLFSDAIRDDGNVEVHVLILV